MKIQDASEDFTKVGILFPSSKTAYKWRKHLNKRRIQENMRKCTEAPDTQQEAQGAIKQQH